MPPNKITNSHEYTKFVLQINDKLSLFFNRRRREKLRITNPFVYIWNIKWYQWVKMGILSLILFPIRAIFMCIFFSLSLLISAIATYKHDLNTPLIGWKKNILLPMFMITGRLTYFFGGLQWITVKGKRSLRDDVPIIVVAPHSAFLDSLIVVHLGMISVLAKMETAKSSIGCLLKMTQPVLVNRDDPHSRQNTLHEIERRCKSQDKWPQIVIFPEGTCTNRTCLINFKTGAFRPGLPVQPVIVRWPNKVDTVTWTWDGPGVLKLVWMTMSQFHTRLEIEFLDPYYPSDEEKEKPKLFANNVRAVMAAALNLSVTDYSYEDCRHMLMAKQAGLPFSEIVVEINKLTRYLIEEYNDEEGAITKLLEINQSIGAKKVSAKEFSKCLHLTDSIVHTIECIFKFYDKNKSGSIFLRELVSHISFFMFPFDRRLALKHSVQAYKDSLFLDEQSACSDVLQHVFVLTTEEVNEFLSVIQSSGVNPNINMESIDETMCLLDGPFNMYSDYFNQYNKSKRQNRPTAVTATTDDDESRTTCDRNNIKYCVNANNGTVTSLNYDSSTDRLLGVNV